MLKNLSILAFLVALLVISGCSNNYKTGSVVLATSCDTGTRDQRATCYTQQAVSSLDISKCQDITTKVSGAYLEEAIDCITLIADSSNNPSLCDQITTVKNTIQNTWEQTVWDEKLRDCTDISSA
ncbi:MAG: hypothetical protein HYS32_01770 [Candidatus Woesearchaeota archaeon]|nr:MAG: hypothetical protein HYS32_01770 [Candidatus Woesearchaeota archaeon]